MLNFDISGAQIDGARDYQEDAFLITHLGDSDTEGGSLVIVADGMGGHAAGNVASNMAVQTFNKHVTSNFPNDSFADVLRESAKRANDSISETVRETAALKGMGCTLVAVVIDQKNLHWVSVGDSHLYLIRANEISKINADHSYGGFLDRMAAEGTPVEAEAGFSRNMLMSALTGEDIAEIDCPDTPLVLQTGDRLIVASDGLDTLASAKVLSYSDDNAAPKAAVEALLKAVEETDLPRQDNTTVVVVDVDEKEDPVQVSAGTPSAPSLASAGVAPQTAIPPSRPAPISEIDDSPSRSGSGLIMGLLVLLALGIAGGAYWYMTKPAKDEFLAGTDLGQTEIVVDSEAEAEPEEVDMEETPDSTETEAEEETPGTAKNPDNPPLGESFVDKLKSGGNGPTMIWIAAGNFAMGSRESGANFDERPQRDVSVTSFAISVNEVTIAEYTKFARAKNRRMPKTGELDPATYPMFFVSWTDAVAYAKWLTTQSGKTYRLPTEAEWEYVARAGTTTTYAWGRRLGRENAHCFACETGLDPRQPTRVGRFKANAFGVFDMAGNIEEWVYDCYNKDYSGAPTDSAIFEGGDCSVRVIRGGAFSSGPKALRSAARSKFRFDKGNDSIGIRIVREQ